MRWRDRLALLFLCGYVWGGVTGSCLYCLNQSLLPPIDIPPTGVGGISPSSLSASSSTRLGFGPTRMTTDRFMGAEGFSGGPITASRPEFTSAIRSDSAALRLSSAHLWNMNICCGVALGPNAAGLTAQWTESPSRKGILLVRLLSRHPAFVRTKYICWARERASLSCSTTSNSAVMPTRSLTRAAIAPDWSLKFRGKRLTASDRRLRRSASRFISDFMRSSSVARRESTASFSSPAIFSSDCRFALALASSISSMRRRALASTVLMRSFALDSTCLIRSSAPLMRASASLLIASCTLPLDLNKSIVPRRTRKDTKTYPAKIRFCDRMVSLIGDDDEENWLADMAVIAFCIAAPVLVIWGILSIRRDFRKRSGRGPE